MLYAACSSSYDFRRCALLMLAALAWLAFLVPPSAAASTLHIETAMFLRQDSAPAMTPSEVPPSGPAGQWRAVTLPHEGLARDMAPSRLANNVEVAWYRLDIDTTAFDNPVLYLPRWQSVGQLAVYGNGHLLYRSGGSAQWSGFNRPLWLPLDTDTPEPVSTVLLRITSLEGVGSGLSSIRIGSANDLRWRYDTRRWIQQELPYLASIVYLAIGLFALGVWAVRRHETIYGLFFAASVVFYLRCLHYHVGSGPMLLNDEWFSWLTITALGWLAIVSYFLAFHLHGRAYPWIERSMLAGMLIVTVAMLPVWKLYLHLVLLAPLTYLGILVVTLFAYLTSVWGAWRARSRDGLLLACWNLLALPIAAHDMLLQSYRISMESVYLLPYTGIGTFAIFLYVAFRRYVGALTEVANARKTLERRLAEQEQKLEHSYRRLREAERGKILAGERQRLMQDMHDGLGLSLLSALRMVQHGGSSKAALAQVLQECLDDLKLTIDSLEPAQADLNVLLATLRFRLGSRLEAAGLQIEWQVTPLPPLAWLTPPAALHVLRILQEVFSNILKHAQARRLTVSTHTDDNEIIIAVTDDGCGFPGPHDAAKEGRGLASLHARVNTLRGRANWRCLERGTRFELRLPKYSH